MQAFEWGVKYPEYVRRIVPIHGGPRQGIYGRAMWELLTRTAEEGVRGAVPIDSSAMSIARLFVLAGTSPAGANRRPDTAYARYIANQARQLRGVDLYEYSWQGRAILRHDIARRFGGNLQEATKTWRAKTLVVAATQDHSIDSEPARIFARLIGADTLVLANPAGHSTIFGDSLAKATVRAWLKR